ncbi:MAG: hypothetical protein QMD01_02065 [Thermodesulfovibrionales bacterium]|nr:hypothetical protein [Thermodesulfovibrionales bacterium]
MKKNWQIIVLGSLAYWIFSLLLHKLFENVNESFKFLELLLLASVAPFILGIIVSIVIKRHRGWVYGSISYIVYFMWVFIFNWIFKLQLEGFREHFLNTTRAFFYLGIVSTLFAAFGGFLGDLLRRRLS